jgi:glycosyltransferase involved in cell wall biosynthesis
VNGSIPLVTVGLPVLNGEQTIAAAIRSILLQTLLDWELLVFDDGSTDRTLGIVASFQDPRISIISDGIRRGTPFRLNQAIEKGRGKYFARMDADDVAYPRRFEAQVRYLDSHPDVDLVGTSTLLFKGQGEAIGKRNAPARHTEITARPFASFPIAHPTYMGRHEWFSKFRYDEEVRRGQDQTLLLRSYRTSRFANLPDILLGYREEQLKISKSFWGRKYFMSHLISGRGRDVPFPMVIRGLVGHSMKFALEVFAIATGLDYRLLRHRVRPASKTELAEWEGVWSSVMDLDVIR